MHGFDANQLPWRTTRRIEHGDGSGKAAAGAGLAQSADARTGNAFRWGAPKMGAH
jgi:hypothetical protein